MKLTILGSGTAVPRPDRASPSLLIETSKSKILCDTGPGTLRQLAAAGILLNEIDLIFYSHFHIDHIADLIPFIFACKYSPGQTRTRDINIMGHHGIRKLFLDLENAYGRWVVPESFGINWIETDNNSFHFTDYSITTIPVKHIESSIAVRIEDIDGKSIVYSGDTDYCSEIIRIADRSDLLVLECSFPDNMKGPGHLTPSLAGKIASESGCMKLILTHFYPPCDTIDVAEHAAKQYAGVIIKAEDMMCVNL